MKKFAALAALSMALGAFAPAMAAENGGLEKAVDGSLMVTRVGGMGAGVAIGTPVAVVRDVQHMYRSWTPSLADKMGSRDFFPSVALVSIATIPASLFWGGVCGTYHGTHNAIVKGFNEPFHPATFSLSKDYEQ